MCKVFGITNMSKIKGLKKTVETIAEYLQASDADGFGYAIQGKKGLFGERTTKDEFTSQFRRVFIEYEFLEVDYNRFGEHSKMEGAGIFHSRTSTNDVNILNTHPIVKNDWTLIHNGVVNNRGPWYERDTTNDSEHLVEYMSTEGIKGVEENISGYYAFMALDPEGKLHIARDNRAKLYFAWSSTIESFIIATTNDLIEDIASEMKWQISVVSAVADNQYIVFDKGGDEFVYDTIKPFGSSWAENKHSSASLGVASSYSGMEDDFKEDLQRYNTIADINGNSKDDKKEEKKEEFPVRPEVPTWGKGDKKERPDDGGMLVKGIDTSEIEVIDEYEETEELKDLASIVAEEEGVALDDYAASIHVFIDCLAHLDSTYTIYDVGDRYVPVEEYDKMPMVEKLLHTLVGPDGTIIDPLASEPKLFHRHSYYTV